MRTILQIAADLDAPVADVVRVLRDSKIEPAGWSGDEGYPPIALFDVSDSILLPALRRTRHRG